MQEYEKRERKYLKPLLVITSIGITALILSMNSSFRQQIGLDPNPTHQQPEVSVERYPEHKNITATVFWVGEAADDSNKFIHNRSSAWVEDWEGAYGGVDDPENRCDYLPCAFTPKENPFYFALPYNDLDDNGDRKSSASEVPWYRADTATDGNSILKNRWVKITRDSKTAYAQWEDVGPFGEDDFGYVFGDDSPSAPEAGIDLSPATASYLQVDGRDQVDWQFIDKTKVPDGPWKTIITDY